MVGLTHPGVKVGLFGQDSIGTLKKNQTPLSPPCSFYNDSGCFSRPGPPPSPLPAAPTRNNHPRHWRDKWRNHRAFNKQFGWRELSITCKTRLSSEILPLASGFANRANNLRAYFDESGFEMMPRVISQNEQAPWNFKYSPLTLQRENDNQPQALNQVTNLLAEDNKIIATRGEGVEEWYLNTPAGLEHGFNLQNRPAGDGPVISRAI